MVVTDVKNIALNLSLPAMNRDLSKSIPSFKFELNFEIKTSPSLTNIPMRAIIPRRDITFTGKLWNKCPHATVVKLNGISIKSKNGWLYVLKVKPITVKIKNRARGNTV